MNPSFAPVPTAAERAALARVSRATPSHRRLASKPGECVVTRYVDGVAQAPEVVAPVVETPAEAAATTVMTAAFEKARASSKPVAAPKAVSTSVVKVDGKLYGSVFKAFVELGLPVNKHVKFRAEFKKTGSKVFEHAGKSFLFEAA